MNGICVHRPKIPERVRLSSVVCGTAWAYCLASWCASNRDCSLARSPGTGTSRNVAKARNFDPQNEALPIEPGSPNFARAFGPAVRREIRKRRDEISIHWGVRGGRKCGAPFPNSKARVGSRSNRCQNEALVQADNLLKFGVDRLSRFGDRGRRKFCSCF
jgi:hypothetical protein